MADLKTWKRNYNREYSRKRRREVIEHYGGNPPKCACCGESIYEFLTIDHIDGKGAEHRRTINSGRQSTMLMSWLRKNGYPKGFQVLCYNCNCGKRTGDVCPHKQRSYVV